MADGDPYLIKRYSNRKLYDSVRRRFTTLDEIAALIDSGVKIVVRDHDAGTDRTEEVLAQLLRRRAISRPGAAGLLADLLRAPADVAGSIVGGLQPDRQASSAGDTEDGVAEDGEAADGEAADGAGDSADVVDETPPPERTEADYERQQDEIKELRDQVSQLTQAVTQLLSERRADD
ncbi:polyhydroxyalkanoate synthesis regulator DNA-binding domain-containing protein [Gordonia shandongensis]|uniref:polyhydroxyalkanoate synthesis regulator DNA-binding domain-containing protein n=1 Tax=Gordonia shandongensis TaxID=376351 RepID=UPI0004200BB9|nr:polyhydroxyalkanoate synthesis regulator DNA-binding domain-containing protein [Gordonia shandongensis]